LVTARSRIAGVELVGMAAPLCVIRVEVLATSG
jgi:hypothetical protein